jgi:NADH-quinone oxidoreductase subunit M
LGPIIHDDVKQVIDLQSREMILLLIPALLILALGFYPDYILKINQIASEEWLSRLTLTTH